MLNLPGGFKLTFFNCLIEILYIAAFQFLYKYKMEQNEAHEERKISNCTPQDKEIFSDGDDSSEKLAELAADTEAGLSADGKEIQLDSRPLSAASNDEDGKLADSFSSTESAANPPYQFSVENEAAALENPNHSVIQLNSNSSSCESNDGGMSNFRREGTPHFYKHSFMADYFSGATNAASRKKSRHKLREQQRSPEVEHESDFSEDGDIFVMEINDAHIPIGMKNKFESDLPTASVEQNLQKNYALEDFKQGSSNSHIANIEQNVITDLGDEFTTVTLKKQLAENNVSESERTSISDIEKHSIQKSKFSKEELSNRKLSSMVCNEGDADLSETSDSLTISETLNVTEKAFQVLNQSDFRVNASTVNAAEQSYESMKLKASDSGRYYEVSCTRISDIHIIELLKRMKSGNLAIGAEEDLIIYGYCKYLLERDCKVKVVNKEKGTLCKNVPARTLVPYINYFPSLEAKVREEIAIRFSEATSNDRFIAPTILYNKQFICRSAPLTAKEHAVDEGATKSTTQEVVGDSKSSKHVTLKYLSIKLESIFEEPSDTIQAVTVGEKVLEYNKVLHIPDLVTEDVKKKYWISLCASDNAYEVSDLEVDVLKMPFPDCEFFRRYHESERITDGLLWDGSNLASDVVGITQNYIETILTHFMREEASIVIHCTTGWDQTPLFIALLRILLWADGLIHLPLSCHEMAYLTLAHDWYLSGHNLSDRLKHGEEIMHFCYSVLENFLDEKFSPTFIRQKPMGLYANLRFLHEKNRRVERIKKVKQIVLALYDKHIINSS